MSRRNARESLYKLMFEYSFYGEKNQSTLEMLSADATLSDDDRAYIKAAYEGIIAHEEELSAMIAKYAEGFKEDRIFKPDRAALLISAYELLYMPDVPPSASISEAVELVKKYSTEKSNSFVNGILASIYKEISAKK